MKMMAVLLFSMFALGCAEKKDEVFSLEEANKCLFDSDKKAVLEAVVWIKKADVAKDEKEAVEYFEKAYEPIQELYAASRDDDSITGRKRSAALAWVLIDFSYNHATGSCAKWGRMRKCLDCWTRIRLWQTRRKNCADIFCRLDSNNAVW